MFGSYYSKQAEATQARKSARAYLAAYKRTLDVGLRCCYRDMFRAELAFARALEREA